MQSTEPVSEKEMTAVLWSDKVSTSAVLSEYFLLVGIPFFLVLKITKLLTNRRHTVEASVPAVSVFQFA